MSEDYVRQRVGELIDEGDGDWTPCSGCQESEDGCVSTRDYPYNDTFRCQPGSGCGECGGIGVIWRDKAYYEMWEEEIPTLASQPAVPSDTEEWEYERAYFERGFIAAVAWQMTKRADAVLSDAIVDHAWDHRDEGMAPDDLLPIRALPLPPASDEGGGA